MSHERSAKYSGSFCPINDPWKWGASGRPTTRLTIETNRVCPTAMLPSIYGRNNSDGDIRCPQCKEKCHNDSLTNWDYCMQIRTESVTQRLESSSESPARLLSPHLGNRQHHHPPPNGKSKAAAASASSLRGRDKSVANTEDFASDAKASVIGTIADDDNKRRGGYGTEKPRNEGVSSVVTDTGRDGVKWLPLEVERQGAPTTTRGKRKEPHKCLVIRRQIVNNGIPLIPLLFLLLFVTTSALPPVIRIGEFPLFRALLMPIQRRRSGFAY